MDCEELRNRIESLSLVAPPSLDSDAVEHLKSCAACMEEFHQYQQAWLSVTSPPTKPTVSERLEQRIMQRIVAAPQPRREYSRRATILKYAVAASLMIILTFATLFRLGVLGPDNPTLTDNEISKIRSIAERMEKLDELERVFASPNLQYVSLESTEPAAPRCYLIQDPMSQQAHFLGTNLQVPQETELRVWLLDTDDGVLVSTSILVQKVSGLGTALLNLNPNSMVKAAMITVEEKDSDPLGPSERVLLRSAVTNFRR